MVHLTIGSLGNHLAAHIRVYFQFYKVSRVIPAHVDIHSFVFVYGDRWGRVESTVIPTLIDVVREEKIKEAERRNRWNTVLELGKHLRIYRKDGKLPGRYRRPGSKQNRSTQGTETPLIIQHLKLPAPLDL